MPEIAAKKEKLLAKILEAETTLSKLYRKLERLEEREQHEMLDHLEEYFTEVDNKVFSLKEFWQAIKDERNEN